MAQIYAEKREAITYPPEKCSRFLICFLISGSLSIACLFQVFQFRNWVEAIELCSLNLKAELKSINFNPSNWHQFNGIDDDGLKVWNFDKVNDQYFLEQRYIFFLTSKLARERAICQLKICKE